MVSKSFSCLTISKRTGWEEQACETLKAQTVYPNKWVIVTEDTIDPFKLNVPFSYWAMKAPEPVRVSNLNASLNAGLKEIETDYVIFYQDYINLPKNCFEKLLGLVDERTFVTTCTINADGSNDSRYLGADLPRPIRPEEWEANVGIAPMKIVRELGGFWEEMDNGWSWDNVHMAQRAAMLGCKFIVDESNRPQLLEHEQTSKLLMEPNGVRCSKSLADIRAGKAPLRYNYLRRLHG